MTNIFTGEGIDFQSASMASTSPSTAQPAIPAGKPVQQDTAASIFGDNEGHDIPGAPQGNPDPSDSGAQPQAAGPQQITQSLAGAGNGGAGAAGEAPPLPSTGKGINIFDAEQIPYDKVAQPQPDSIQQNNSDALNQGLTLSPTGGNNSDTPISRAEMSMPPAEQSVFHEQQRAQVQKAAADMAAMHQQSVDLATKLYGDNQVKQWQSTPQGPAEGFMEAVRENRTLPIADLSNAVSAARLQKISQQYSATGQLTPEDKQFAADYIHGVLEQEVRGFTRGGKLAYNVSQLPAWMYEFAVADGAAGFLSKGVEGVAGAAGLGEGAASVAGSLSKLPITTALMPAQYVPAYAERRLNDSTAITDQGDLVAKQAKESPAKAAFMTLGGVASDVASVYAMPQIGKYVVDPATKLLTTPIITAASKLPPATTEMLFKAYQAVKPAATYSEMLTPAGWRNMATAVGSFQMDKILRTTLEYSGSDKMTFPDAMKAMPMDTDELFLAAGLTAIHGSVSTAHTIMSTILERRGLSPAAAEEATSNMSATEKQDFVDKNMILPQSPTPTFHTESPTARIKPLSSGDTNNYSVLNKNGETAGTIYTSKTASGDTQISTTSAIPDEKGNGYFSDAYKQLADKVISSGKTLESDEIVSQEADLLYKSLMRKGYQIDKNPNTNINKDGDIVSTDGNPVYRVIGGPRIHADAPQGPDAAKNIIVGGSNEAVASAPALVDDKQSGFNAALKASKVYAEMWNDLQPIEDLGKKARAAGAPISEAELSPAALSLAKSTPALIERQWTVGTTTWDKDGNQVTTGKGLKQIGDDFDNIMMKYEPDAAVRTQDMSDFRKAMTFTEDSTKGYNPVSDKDLAESQATLSRLADKYGDQMKWFETFAKEYRDWDNRILHNLVTSGLKTQAWYDDLVGKREWYSSTARVTESEYPDDVAAINKNLGASVNPKSIGALKQRKGSDKEVIDPVQSSMRNSAIILRRAMLNKVRVDTAKYAKYYPDQVKVKPPMIIQEAVTHNYDPKLRSKLEQIAEFIGSDVKRMKPGENVGGKKNNLGAYHPGDARIELAAGTTEGTLTHEIGHALDYRLGLKDKLLKDPQMKAELERLAEDRLRAKVQLEKTPDGKTQFVEEFERSPKKYVDYVKNPDEILANMFDAYVNSPKQAREKAPKAIAEFEKLLDSDPQLAALKDIAPSTQRATETIQRALLDFKGPKDSLPFYDKGQLKFLHMDEETAKAFKGLDQVDSTLTGGFIAKIGKAQAKALQFGATNNPYFIARHFLRGAQSSYVNTEAGGGARGFFQHFAVEIPKGIAAVIGKTDAYREWASSSGALRTYMDTSTKGIAKLHDEIFNSTDMSKFLDPRKWQELTQEVLKNQSGESKPGAALGNAWQTAKQVSDYAPRIAAYERLKDKGYSDLQAGFLSLEATGNYIRHGALGKEINAYSPFFNDRLQGADRFLRAVKRDPGGYATRAIALITMPQLLITGYYLYAADDQTRKEYLNLSDFRRSAAMNIKINGHWIPVPRAFAPGFAFGALPEFAMIHFSGIAHPELKNFWLHMLGDTVNALSPSTDWTQTIPPVIKASLENITNFSFFRQQAIFKGDTKDTAPENQFNSSTSESAKALGKLLGYSPAKIDNTAYDMAAHIGVYAQQLSDYALNKERAAQGKPVNERPTRGSDNPVYGPMMQPAPVGTASESFQEFQEHMQDSDQQANRFKELKGQEQADFRNENHADLMVHPRMAAINTEVTHEEHEIRLITQNTNLDGDEKTRQINLRQAKIEMLVENANQYYRQGTGQK